MRIYKPKPGDPIWMQYGIFVHYPAHYTMFGYKCERLTHWTMFSCEPYRDMHLIKLSESQVKKINQL